MRKKSEFSRGSRGRMTGAGARTGMEGVDLQFGLVGFTAVVLKVRD